MKNKIVLLTGVSLIILALISLFGSFAAAQTGEDCATQRQEVVEINGANYLLARCIASETEPTPDPTEQPTIEPTPTIGVTVTPPPTGGVEPFPAAEQCEDHDPRAYHTLWNSELGCYYNHQHGDDPHELDDVFGTQVYEWFGADNDGFAEVGYPWETPNENATKHIGYIWKTARDLDCRPLFGMPGCFTDFRSLSHGMATAQGAVTASHSYFLEARVCRNEDAIDCGIMRMGGWLGPASLTIDQNPFLLDRRGLDVYGEPFEFPTDQQRNFLHYYDEGNRCCGTWYTGSKSGGSGVVLEFGDMWETVPPIDSDGDGTISEDDIVAASSRRGGTNTNGSRIQTHIVLAGGWPQRIRAQYDPDGDGTANLAAFTDRMGFLKGECTEIGPDCVPISLEDFPMVLAQYRGGYVDYDIYFGSVSSGWLAYPPEANNGELE